MKRRIVFTSTNCSKSLLLILLFSTILLFNSCYKEQTLDFNTPLNELELRCKIDGKAFSGIGKYIPSTPQNRKCSGGVDVAFHYGLDSLPLINIEAANCGFAPIYEFEFKLINNFSLNAKYTLGNTNGLYNNTLYYNTFYKATAGYIKFTALNDSILSGEFEATVPKDNSFVHITEGRFLIHLKKL